MDHAASPVDAITALVLADDERLQELLAAVLGSRNHEVVLVSGLDTLLHGLTLARNALVILQWPGPGRAAEDACKRIAAARGETPLVVLSVITEGEGHEVLAALDAGADDVLVWPAPVPVVEGRVRILEARIRELDESQDAEAALRAVEQLSLHDQSHDTLTGLHDRARFLDRLQRVFERARRQGSRGLAVLFLDVDRFKLVNDSLGHMAGDRLLVGIARRLESSLRPTDTVARLGGDEFAILLDDVSEPREATTVAERIQQALRVPVDVGGQEVFASVSVGIAHLGPGYRKSEELLRDADTAMYRAKALGRDQYAVFDDGMHEKAVAALQLENDLRRAVNLGEFGVHYQPIVALENGTIVGFEALVRWQHPRRGLVLPGEFVQVAEETGLIIPIDRFVAAEACRQLRAWNVQFRRSPALTMSVNVSGAQFLQPDLPMLIDRILRDNGLWGTSLKLEITESVIMEKARYTGPMLEHLRGLAIKLSIDDFGTGYSSLSYLRRFEIDTLKIDSSFVAKMTHDDDSSEIVRAIVTLAHNLGKEMIAEGVETASQLAKLREMRCTHAQGYYFSRPVGADAAARLLTADPHW